MATTIQPASAYQPNIDPMAFQQAPGSGLMPVMTPLDPKNDLRGQQITPGASVDRFKLAGQQFGTFANSTQSAFDAALRDANRAAAATGRLGSGMLRTSFGDLANQRNQQLQTSRDTLFQNALLGSVQDAQQNFNNLLAERAFQEGAQNQAFNQAITGIQTQDQLTNSAFNRAYQQNIAGQSGNPYDAQLLQAQILGQQGGIQSLLDLMKAQQGLNAARTGTPATLPANVLNPSPTTTFDWSSLFPTSPYNYPTGARQPAYPNTSF